VFPSCVVRNDGDNTYNTSVNVSLEWPLDVETKNEVLTEVSRVSTAVVALISPSAGMQLMRLQFALYGRFLLSLQMSWSAATVTMVATDDTLEAGLSAFTLMNYSIWASLILFLGRHHWVRQILHIQQTTPGSR
jgi:hypothetical protein